jgi:hypothetical protein
MNVNTDPVILKKLEDFRVRRRNLILLRGICTGFVTLILTFTTIALIDFATQARCQTISVRVYLFWDMLL